jgi:hypothetical protein
MLDSFFNRAASGERSTQILLRLDQSRLIESLFLPSEPVWVRKFRANTCADSGSYDPRSKVLVGTAAGESRWDGRCAWASLCEGDCDSQAAHCVSRGPECFPPPVRTTNAVGFSLVEFDASGEEHTPAILSWP